MYYTIYKITNTINGKLYIGKHQTVNLDDEYMGSGKYLKHAIKKYGVDSFIKETLFIFDNEEEMNEKEKELVNEEFVSRNDTYNICEGGKGGFSYINKNNLKSKEGTIKGGKMASININSRLNLLKESEYKAETRRKNMAIGRKFSNTEKANINRINTFEKIKHQQGKTNSQYGTCWINNMIENKKIQMIELDTYLSIGYVKGRLVQRNKT